MGKLGGLKIGTLSSWQGLRLSELLKDYAKAPNSNYFTNWFKV